MPNNNNELRKITEHIKINDIGCVMAAGLHRMPHILEDENDATHTHINASDN